MIDGRRSLRGLLETVWIVLNLKKKINFSYFNSEGVIDHSV